MNWCPICRLRLDDCRCLDEDGATLSGEDAGGTQRWTTPTCERCGGDHDPEDHEDVNEGDDLAGYDPPDETERSEEAEARGMNPWDGRAR